MLLVMYRDWVIHIEMLILRFMCNVMYDAQHYCNSGYLVIGYALFSAAN